jgi:hypothetical protein
MRSSGEDLVARKPQSAKVKAARKTKPQKARVADAGSRDKLIDRLDQHYRAVVTNDLELFALHKRRTQANWELGEVAIALKALVPHGEWLSILKARGYVERTIQRAMRIYKLFKNKKEECIALTVEEAERGESAEEASESVAVQRPRSQQALRRGASPRKPARRPEPDDQLEDNTDEVPDSGEDSEADVYLERSEHLWGLVCDAGEQDLVLNEEERAACDTFLSQFKKQDRALCVLLYQAWRLAFSK